MDVREKERLVPVDVADAGHHALIQQSVADRSARTLLEFRPGEVRIEIRPKRIGAEAGEQGLSRELGYELAGRRTDEVGRDGGGFETEADRGLRLRNAP